MSAIDGHKKKKKKRVRISDKKQLEMQIKLIAINSLLFGNEVSQFLSCIVSHRVRGTPNIVHWLIRNNANEWSSLSENLNSIFVWSKRDFFSSFFDWWHVNWYMYNANNLYINNLIYHTSKQHSYLFRYRLIWCTVTCGEWWCWGGHQRPCTL